MPFREVLEILHLSYVTRTTFPLRKAAAPVIVGHSDCNQCYQCAATAARPSFTFCRERRSPSYSDRRESDSPVLSREENASCNDRVMLLAFLPFDSQHKIRTRLSVEITTMHEKTMPGIWKMTVIKATSRCF